MNFSSFLRHHWRQLRQLFWRMLTLPSRALSGISRGFGRLMRHWWASRKFRYLVRGLPSLLAAGVCGYLAIVVSMQTTHSKALAYTTAARSAMDSGQYGAAKLYYQRVVELDAADNKALYDLARAAYEIEDYAQVATIVQSLAPLDRPGYADAHIWQAKEHYAHSARSIEQLDLAEKHLRYALQLRPGDVEVHAMLGEIYFRKELWDDASRHLEHIALGQPDAQLMLAKAYAMAGRQAPAQRWGTAAQSYYARLVEDDPHDLESRIAYADSTMFLEQYQSAANILKQGIKHSDDPRLQVGLARVYTAQADAITPDDPRQRSRRFELLSAALLLNPSDMVIFDRMIDLMQTEDETAEQARDFLLDNITQGRATAISHLLLGTLAIMGDEYDQTARFHLAQAFQQAPQTPAVMNNLAWFLVHSSPSQPEEALKLIEPLIEAYPNDLRFVDTRGHILLALSRWNEAIVDLERALKILNGNSHTHAGLARAYEALGQDQLAERHRRQAEQTSISP